MPSRRRRSLTEPEESFQIPNCPLYVVQRLSRRERAGVFRIINMHSSVRLNRRVQSSGRHATLQMRLV